MRDALNATGRNFIYSIHGKTAPGEFQVCCSCERADMYTAAIPAMDICRRQTVPT